MTRKGFTLIEMLVTITIALILAGLVAAFAPGFRDRQKVPRAADQLQGWLAISRQWAKRDRVPTGVRLIFEKGANVVTELQYIQQPPNFVVVQPNSGNAFPSAWPISVSGTTVSLVNFPSAGLFNGFPVSGFSGGLPAYSAAVQAGDYLVIDGHVYKIILATELNLSLASSPRQISSTTDYCIVRSPRPLVGEPSLKLTQDAVIDFRSRSLNVSSTSTDIVFSPNGEMIFPVVANGPIVILWICDNSKLGSTSTNPPPIADDLLIVVNPHTGLIACQQVATSGGPYFFCYDGRHSGM